MYTYNHFDQTFVDERVAQFRDQTARFLAGQLSEDEFRPLRLQNGLYVQRHAPMLRVAVPYGELSSKQMRMFAHIARKYDKGYGHFTTRQNIQYNWPALETVPDILADLASVQMHGIQTSGNCVRNVTSDHFAGIAADEITDPRPMAELIRQWSTVQPEFLALPRKFKIAVNAAKEDRTALQLHDLAVEALSETTWRIWVGGGMGRTPILARQFKDVPRAEVLGWIESILRVYNLYGRRDNIYKARIKILVDALGIERFRTEVEEDFAAMYRQELAITEASWNQMKSHWSPSKTAPQVLQTYEGKNVDTGMAVRQLRADNRAFDRWVERNVFQHKVPGFAAVTISLKAPGRAPGDATGDEMDLIAKWADDYSGGELRISHEQNLILADVPAAQLFSLWSALTKAGMAKPTVGLLTNIIACPGGDFCALANARSLPLAEAILQRFDNIDYVHDLGDLDLNISGCINSCGHHHVGHIGILGVDKNGEEWYQILLGGAQGSQASLAKVIGPSFAVEQVPGAIARMLDVYVNVRNEGERFLETYRRIGLLPFKAAAYEFSEAK
jgi:sulfite reductase (NADPH) hemoprotein beta-component